MEEIRVGIVGTKFMGRAHSNAYMDVAHFFELPADPVMQVACGRNVSDLQAFAARSSSQSRTSMATSPPY